jgi:ABC-2 type transport system ATP-binding protein
MIEIRDVCKSFNGIKALDRFSFEAATGEIVGLIGPNGAGKTTLIKIVAALLPADSGEVRIGGQAVSRANRQLQSAIGYMADFAGLYHDMRVFEFLEFFADAFHLPSDKKKQAIENALSDSGLSDRKEHFVEHLSFGLKQRLLLAKTTLHSPSVLLLDEPATGLDPIARGDLRQQLKRWLKPDRNILISSHIMSDLEEICHEVVFIADGRNAGKRRFEKAADGIDEEKTIIEISTLSGIAETERIIKLNQAARIVDSAMSDFVIEIEGGAENAAALLVHMVQSGIRVCRFNPRKRSLEETYKSVFGSKRE